MNDKWDPQKGPDHASPTYDPLYAFAQREVEDRHFWFQARRRVIASEVQRIRFGQRGPLRILEAGCGTGEILPVLARSFPGALVVGMDLFREMLQLAKGRAPGPLLQGDIFTPPFGESFHLVGLFDVLEHLDEQEKVLGDIRRLMVPEGVLILTVPALPSLWSFTDEAAFHRRRYRRREIEDLLLRCGFRPESVTYFFASLVPLVWLARRFAPGRYPSASVARSVLSRRAMGELKVIPGLNGLLLALLGAERLASSCGFRLPFGTSLLSVARKGA